MTRDAKPRQLWKTKPGAQGRVFPTPLVKKLAGKGKKTITEAW